MTSSPAQLAYGMMKFTLLVFGMLLLLYLLVSLYWKQTAFVFLPLKNHGLGKNLTLPSLPFKVPVNMNTLWIWVQHGPVNGILTPLAPSSNQLVVT